MPDLEQTIAGFLQCFDDDSGEIAEEYVVRARDLLELIRNEGFTISKQTNK